MTQRRRELHRIARFTLESGEVLHDVEQAYYLDGRLNAEKDNLVVIFHALTGSADAVGDWWSEVLGPGRTIDTDRYAVLCVNLVGSCYGSTGPADPSRRPFPLVGTRDLARLIRRVVDDLGVRRVRLATGGSLGGMVALEWAATFPELTGRTVVFAAPARHTASAIGWSYIQRRAIAAAGEEGLRIARMVAMMTYRTGAEFAARFDRRRNEAGGYEVEGYLASHGDKLLARFDTHSYLALVDAMDAHDVGAGRGSVAEALRPAGSRLVGVGIPGDLLYTDGDVRAWVEAVGADYRRIDSVCGHDAFLIECDQVSVILAEALAEAEAEAGRSSSAAAAHTRTRDAGPP